jgi:hypothetical protein
VAPKTEYAEKGEINIAYQVVGEGPMDLVLVNGIVAHLDLLWSEPEGAAMLRHAPDRSGRGRLRQACAGAGAHRLPRRAPLAGTEGLALEHIDRGDTPELRRARRLFVRVATDALAGA